MNVITNQLREHVLSRGLYSNTWNLIRTNQLGYLPQAPKTAVLETDGTLIFRLVNCVTGEILDEQTITAEKRHFGTCEYWTPMVAHTMWLAALLKAEL